MSDLIKREDAIKALYKYSFVSKDIIEREIKAIPSVDIPHSDDWEKYSDKLWKTAYERGKADRPQGDEFKNFDRESLILLIEVQKERIGELLADRPQGDNRNE